MKKCDFRAVQRSALCKFRGELSNAYLLAKFGFDTAENEPSKVCRIWCACRDPASASRHLRLRDEREDGGSRANPSEQRGAWALKPLGLSASQRRCRLFSSNQPTYLLKNAYPPFEDGHKKTIGYEKETRQCYTKSLPAKI